MKAKIMDAGMQVPDVMNVASVTRTHVGKVRENNEDSMLLDAPHLFAIADGMGGYNAGEIASQLALEQLEKATDTLHGTPLPQLETALHSVVKQINRVVYEKAQSEEKYEGMGTTLTGVYFSSANKAYVFNIGDSRLYLLRNGELKQVTRDHSLVAEMVEKGEITAEESFSHPKKNILTRGIGVNAEAEADIFVLDTKIDDIFLLCSDGLTDMLHDRDIGAILQQEELSVAADRLLKDALDRGGKDNITFILLKMGRKEVEHHGR